MGISVYEYVAWYLSIYKFEKMGKKPYFFIAKFYTSIFVVCYSSRKQNERSRRMKIVSTKQPPQLPQELELSK